jgi:hypothetical protein
VITGMVGHWRRQISELSEWACSGRAGHATSVLAGTAWSWRPGPPPPSTSGLLEWLVPPPFGSESLAVQTKRRNDPIRLARCPYRPWGGASSYRARLVSVGEVELSPAGPLRQAGREVREEAGLVVSVARLLVVDDIPLS